MKKVIWIGGSPDSGKTTVAKALVRKYQMDYYDYDLYEDKHHQLMASGSKEGEIEIPSSPEDVWLHTSKENLLSWAHQSFNGRFPYVLRDLSKYQTSSTILAEGFGLTPELVFPYLDHPKDAVWIISSEEKKREMMLKRNKMNGMFNDPEKEIQAEENMLQRDLKIGSMIKEQADELGLSVIHVDKNTSIEQVYNTVEKQFERILHCY
ncbi:hypothetical protein [Pontibacillus marinus]|uniref:Uncharacterized protein n=1 Tax=Pontibacillus marinus BH030004 = DSM 16465 TaxID=1385511 RepID=A0A0A5G7H9_9BACI|nr:hypothetical protein [Pontibacillus marinus]KGX87133.1 hypothetical protein N783_10305 [Pontibacillus marinus BH030004 = DSM 16465]